MAKYLEVAKEARKQIERILDSSMFGATEKVRADLVKELAYLYNLGIRTSPRACQSTVRLRAVQEAIRGFGVQARLEEVERDGYSFKKLVLTANTAVKEKNNAI